MSVKTLTINDVKTHPLKIDINTSVAKGYFTGHAIVRPKDEVEGIRQAVMDGEYEDREEELLRDMFESFDGFGEADGFEEILKGKASAYLTPAAISAYFEQFGEARKGNSKKRRSR